MAEKLVVVVAFDRNDDGNLVPAEEPRQFTTEASAKSAAETLSRKHAGVIAWSRSADPEIGEYGEPTVLAQYGDVPEME